MRTRAAARRAAKLCTSLYARLIEGARAVRSSSVSARRFMRLSQEAEEERHVRVNRAARCVQEVQACECRIAILPLPPPAPLARELLISARFRRLRRYAALYQPRAMLF